MNDSSVFIKSGTTVLRSGTSRSTLSGRITCKPLVDDFTIPLIALETSSGVSVWLWFFELDSTLLAAVIILWDSAWVELKGILLYKNDQRWHFGDLEVLEKRETGCK